MTAYLHKSGILVNHKKVLKIMRMTNCLSKIYHHKFRKYSSYEGHRGKLYPNLINRRFMTDQPYQKLTTDVSEFRYGNQSIHERIYLSPIMDSYSGMILDYNIGNHPSLDFTLKPVKAVLKLMPKLPYRTTLNIKLKIIL